MSKLPTPFKENGTVTAGNASGVNDGAGCLLIASEDMVKKYSLRHWQDIVGERLQELNQSTWELDQYFQPKRY